eukprot:2643784-Amphidinium_carterae.1
MLAKGGLHKSTSLRYSRCEVRDCLLASSIIVATVLAQVARKGRRKSANPGESGVAPKENATYSRAMRSWQDVQDFFGPK